MRIFVFAALSKCVLINDFGEIRGVICTQRYRYIGWLHSLMEYTVPVERLQPLTFLDVVYTIF